MQLMKQKFAYIILTAICIALFLPNKGHAETPVEAPLLDKDAIWVYKMDFRSTPMCYETIRFRITDTVEKYGKQYYVYKAVSGTSHIKEAFGDSQSEEYYLREEDGKIYALPCRQMLTGKWACEGLQESDEFILYAFPGPNEDFIDFAPIVLAMDLWYDTYKKLTARMHRSKYTTYIGSKDYIYYDMYAFKEGFTPPVDANLGYLAEVTLIGYVVKGVSPILRFGHFAWLDPRFHSISDTHNLHEYNIFDYYKAAPTIDGSRTWEYLEYERLADGRVGCSAIGCRFDGEESVGDREYSVFKTVYRKSWVMDADEDFTNPRNISEITTQLLDERRALLREQAGILYRYVDADLADAAADPDGISLTEGEEIPLYDFNLQAGEIPAVYAFSPEGSCIAVTSEISETEDLLVDGNKGQIIRGDFPDYAEFAGVIADGFLEMPLTASTPEKKIIFNNLYDADGNIIYRGNDDQTLAGVSLPSASEPSAVEYYNLQGVRIDNPAKGQPVIRRHAGRSEKLIIH